MTDVEIQLFLELIHHTSTETELDFRNFLHITLN